MPGYSTVAYIEFLQDQQSLRDLTERLRNAFRFTDADLEANRAGRIGPSQRKALIERVVFPPALALGVGVAVSLALRVLWAAIAEHRNVLEYGFILCGDVVTFNLSGLYHDFIQVGGVDMPRAVRAILMMPIGWSLLHVRKGSWEALMDLFRGTGSVQGRASVESETKNDQTRYFYNVDKLRLPVGPEARDTLVFGQEYRVYYAKESRFVLSGEAIPDSERPLTAHAEPYR